MPKHMLLFFILIITLAGCQHLLLPITRFRLPETRPATSIPSTTPSGSWHCYQAELACYNTLYFLAMLSENEGWAVGTNDVLLHYTIHPSDTSPSWRRVTPTEPPLLTSLSFDNPETGRALTDEGVVVYFRNKVWQQPPSRYGIVLGHVQLAPDESWAVGAHGRIVHRYQGKETLHLSPDEDDALQAIAMLNRETGWIVGSQAILRYENQTWIEEPNYSGQWYPTLYDIQMVSPNEGWAVGQRFVHYQNNQWQDVTEGDVHNRTFSLDMLSPDEGWAVGTYGAIHHYTAAQWQPLDKVTENSLGAVDMVSPDEGWAIGEYATILRYQQGEWQLVHQEIPPAELLEDTIGLPNGEGWAVGSQGKILHYSQQTWQNVDSPTDTKLNGIDMVTPTEGWAVGWDGTIIHYTQNQWQLSTNPIGVDLIGVSMVNEQEGWIVGQNGVMLRYAEGVWQPFPSPAKATLVDIDMFDETTGWAVGYDGTILSYSDDTWILVEPITSEHLQDVQAISPTQVWAMGWHVMLRYHNNEWQEIPLPAADITMHAMSMLSGDEGWFMTDQGAYYYQAGDWTLYDSPMQSIASLAMLNEHEGWAVGMHGIMHYSIEE